MNIAAHPTLSSSAPLSPSLSSAYALFQLRQKTLPFVFMQLQTLCAPGFSSSRVFSITSALFAQNWGRHTSLAVPLLQRLRVAPAKRQVEFLIAAKDCPRSRIFRETSPLANPGAAVVNFSSAVSPARNLPTSPLILLLRDSAPLPTMGVYSGSREANSCNFPHRAC